MGANAQTTVQKFVDGAVLTAAQQNTSAATGVPVFATTVTRDAAFGGANKVLAEGQTCYLESTNVVQYYDGAAWATVGPAAAAALVYLTGASFTTENSVSLPAGTFSATYDNYKVILNITAASVNESQLSLRYRVAGADNTTGNYNSGFARAPFSGGALANDGSASATSANLGVVAATAPISIMVMDVIHPFLSVVTKTVGGGLSYQAQSFSGGTNFAATTSFDAMTFFPSSGTFSGSYKVYGYANS